MVMEISVRPAAPSTAATPTNSPTTESSLPLDIPSSAAAVLSHTDSIRGDVIVTPSAAPELNVVETPTDESELAAKITPPAVLPAEKPGCTRTEEAPIAPEEVEILMSAGDEAAIRAAGGGMLLTPAGTPSPTFEFEEVVKPSSATVDLPATIPKDLLPDGEGVVSASRNASGSLPAVSRVICLRSLRGQAATAGGGQEGTSQVTERTKNTVENHSGPGADDTKAIQGDALEGVAASIAGGGIPTNPTTGKVVDLRGVKKVKPVPLAASPFVLGTEEKAEDSDVEDDGVDGGGDTEEGGPVKVDLAAGKRMIQAQLRMNAVEEMRLEKEKERERDATEKRLFEDSQRMLAQINARIDAQRRGRVGLAGSWNVPIETEMVNDRAHAEERIREIADEHGIRVRFVDDGYAAALARIQSLAQQHGIAIEIGGSSFEGRHGGIDPIYVNEPPRDTSETGTLEQVKDNTPDSSRGDQRAGTGIFSTPPPLLSSLRQRPVGTAVSESASATQASARKASPVPLSGPREKGLFGGTVRMMKIALMASGSKSSKSSRLADDIAVSQRSAGQEQEQETSPSDATITPPLSAATSDSSVKDNGDVEKSSGLSEPAAQVSRSRQGAESRGETKQPQDRANGSVAPADDMAAQSDSEVEQAQVKETGVVQKTRTVREGVSDTIETPTRPIGNRSEEEFLPDRSSISSGIEDTKRRRATMSGTGGDRRLAPSATAASFDSKTSDGEALREREGRGMSVGGSGPIISGAPKRMRLVGPSGVISQSEPVTPIAAANRPPRRGNTSTGAGWTPGNNNLFKGAMAGIIGRGKRPAP